MSYINRTAITATMPEDFLIEALDDDNDGAEDAGLFEAVAAEASGAVDAYLSAKFAVPFEAPLPPLVAEAAKIFFCELLHTRRGNHGEDNPFTERADLHRKMLAKAGVGAIPLQVAKKGARPSVSFVTEPARTHSKNLNT